MDVGGRSVDLQNNVHRSFDPINIGRNGNPVDVVDVKEKKYYLGNVAGPPPLPKCIHPKKKFFGEKVHHVHRKRVLINTDRGYLPVDVRWTLFNVHRIRGLWGRNGGQNGTDSVFSMVHMQIPSTIRFEIGLPWALSFPSIVPTR